MKRGKTKIASIRSLAEIYQNWQSEDQELESSIAVIRDWMEEVSKFGTPHFGETATRLKPLRQRLVQHFEREDEMLAEIASSHLTSSQMVSEMNTQSMHDRQRLLDQLNDLMNRLEQLDPPFASWQQATEEVDGLVGVLETHERREAANVEKLIPPSELA
jgi:chromosome segregation ATPase